MVTLKDLGTVVIDPAESERIIKEAGREPISVFTINDLTNKNYYFKHKKKVYFIPYPSVQLFSYIEELLNRETTDAEKLMDNNKVFWLLYYDSESVYQGYDIPKYKLFFGMIFVWKWWIKVRYLGAMMESLTTMLSCENLTSSDDKYASLYNKADSIIGVSQKTRMDFSSVMSMKIPAYLCVLKNLDTLSYIEKDMYESNSSS